MSHFLMQQKIYSTCWKTSMDFSAFFNYETKNLFIKLWANNDKVIL